jgi:hypothetical protein
VSYWLSFNDLLAVQQLQRRGVQLDLERAVLWPHTPLHAALVPRLPFSMVSAETIVLYSGNSRHSRAVGFIQARERRGRPEGDIVFIAPSLDADDDAVSIWYRLLAECAQQIGARGGQRLFAQVSSGNGVEEVFRQAGFSSYAREDIYRLTDWPKNLAKDNSLRHQRARDGWTLLRLYAQFTPRPVQIAEGMLSPEGQGGKMGDWWDQSSGSGYILETESEVIGAVRVRRGRAAYWLRFWLHPQSLDQGETLVHGAQSLLWAAPHRPIYCSVRDYESGLRNDLEAAGFEYLLTRSLLVKHTTVRAKEPLIKLMPALEKRPEPAASVSHLRSKAGK